ncbi:ABC-type Fe3+-hydroxamate transport system substrate-binding protein [Paenibacillus sp. PastF-3]|uniref:helix-turn-helix domain-containing protein n=1 Tax=Paenibacillus sp. PastF-3 TaxID=2940626 RepID=UPI00247302A5|nr:helix-turn-helix domain-containing protein [Paenibacillus sp. PastF-3]MDH6369250.1 ABC-type Fe3+-hydroxamate transport system substrate-binding protein [Paenibacillus sp. PastF-3]
MDQFSDNIGRLEEDNPLGRVWFRIRDCFRDTEGSSYNRLLYTTAPAHALIATAGPSGHIVIDGHLYPFDFQTVYFILPGQRVEVSFDSFGDRLLYNIQFDLFGTDADCTLTERWIANRRSLKAVADTVVETLCEKIVIHWNTGDPADRLASQSGFQELLHLLLKRRSSNEGALERTRLHMDQHYRDTVTIESLAEMVGMSRYYFMRMFKERFGQSAIDYLTELRTNEAKRLLEAGCPLATVAEAVGYKDPMYFSSQFKKQVGIPPRIYIKNRKTKIAAYSWPNIGHLLTLRMIPYAAPIDQNWTDDYRRKYRYDIKVPLSHDYDFNRLALQQARPDKIIALDEMIPEEEKERLRKIAPSLFLGWHREDWRSHLQSVAGFLDREKEGESWLSRYDEQVEAVRRNVSGCFRKGKMLIFNISHRGIQLWGRRAGTVLYDDLQFQYAQGVEHIEFTEYVEAERLMTFDADIILISVTKDHQSQTEWERLQRTEPWIKLKAVQNGNVYLTSGHKWLQEPILEYTANRHEQLLQELNLLFRVL